MRNKHLSLLTLIMTFTLLIIGALVHNTNSAFSCPDWPLCYSDSAKEGLRETFNDIYFPIAHRFFAGLVSILVGLLLFSTYKKRKVSNEYQQIFTLNAQAFSLILVQGLVGWVTVTYKLPSLVSTGHLILSVIFFSTLIFFHHRLSFVERLNSWDSLKEEKDFLKKLPVLRDGVNCLLLLWILQMIAGGILRHTGAGLACGPANDISLKCADPFAQGALIWPTSLAAQFNLAHRMMGTFIVILGFFYLPQIFLVANKIKNLEMPLKKRLTGLPIIILFIFIAQVLMGVATLKSGLSVLPTTIHLGLALISLALLWKTSLYMGDIEKNILKDKAQTKIRDFIELTKPRLGFLVMVTAFVGLMMTTKSIGIFQAILGLILITMVVMGATSLNCYMEKDIDGLMERTKNRALPAGRLSSKSALVFGSTLLIISLPFLYFTVNPLTSYLAALAAILYLVIYTPMKQMSPLAVYVGAIPGAIPPVLGWTMVSGKMDPMAWALFWILFVWQIPHFFAISIYYAQDYRNASIKVYSNSWSFKFLVWMMIIYTFILGVLSWLPLYLGQVTDHYGPFALVLNILFFVLSCMGLFFFDDKKQQEKWARAYFLASIIYLPLLLGAVIFLKVA